MKLFAHPFGTDATKAPEMFQLELFEVQNNSERKRAFAEHDLSDILWSICYTDLFPNLSQHALKFISLFGST